MRKNTNYFRDLKHKLLLGMTIKGFILFTLFVPIVPQAPYAPCRPFIVPAFFSLSLWISNGYIGSIWWFNTY
jgi:hypothetical protein